MLSVLDEGNMKSNDEKAKLIAAIAGGIHWPPPDHLQERQVLDLNYLRDLAGRGNRILESDAV